MTQRVGVQWELPGIVGVQRELPGPWRGRRTRGGGIRNPAETRTCPKEFGHGCDDGSDVHDAARAQRRGPSLRVGQARCRPGEGSMDPPFRVEYLGAERLLPILERRLAVERASDEPRYFCGPTGIAIPAAPLTPTVKNLPLSSRQPTPQFPSRPYSRRVYGPIRRP